MISLLIYTGLTALQIFLMWKWILPKVMEAMLEDRIADAIEENNLEVIQPKVQKIEAALRTYKPAIEELQANVDELYSLGQAPLTIPLPAPVQPTREQLQAPKS